MSSRAFSLAWAAELSSRDGVRSGRLIAAAESAAGAGTAQFAISLLDELDELDEDGLDGIGSGRAISLRAMLAVFLRDRGGVSRSMADLLAAAGVFLGVIPELEQRTLIRAFELR